MENENANLKLWKQVEKTPIELIKIVKTEDGKELNSVPSINRFKKATEMFGLYGKSWGLKDLEHTELRLSNNLVFGNLKAVFFYTMNENRIEFEITNSIAIVSMYEQKMKVNFTYRKALETDTVTKALSKLGFNADIYTDGELVEGAGKSEDIDIDDIVQIGEDLKEKGA